MSVRTAELFSALSRDDRALRAGALRPQRHHGVGEIFEI